MEILSSSCPTNIELKEFLDFKATQYENTSFIESDPIQIPKKYSRKEDIEIIALITATISWGNRKSIIKSGHKLINLLGESPFDYVMSHTFNDKLNFVHRTFNGIDLNFFLMRLNYIYTNFESLESCFRVKNSQQHNLYHRINNFREIFFENQDINRTHKHVANPITGSSCKRIIMFLRWMVRSSICHVDFGLWKSISTSELMIPLDVHTGTISRKLGLLQRNQNDWKSNELLHSKLIEFDENDPAKYDFALFGLGIFESF